MRGSISRIGLSETSDFFNILNENAALIILSCGMSLVMITGGIDISVGMLTALVCMSCAVNLDYNGGNVLTSILIALGIGAAFGLVQGYLIAYLEITAVYRYPCGYVLCKGYDHHSQRHPVQCCKRGISGA